MVTSKEGIDLIKEFESFRGEAYLDPAGIPTIGWGTTRINEMPVQLGMQINEPVGDLLLAYDLGAAEREVTFLVEKEINQNQFDALVSFQYNTGGLERSTLLYFINNNREIVENLFTRWNKAHVNGVLTELPGLTRRRKAEYNLYIRP